MAEKKSAEDRVADIDKKLSRCRRRSVLFCSEKKKQLGNRAQRD